MSNGKPDPKCQDCGGKGVIELFTSSSKCECVDTTLILTIDYEKLINAELIHEKYAFKPKNREMYYTPKTWEK